MRSRDGSARSPRIARRSPIRTRPARIKSSTERRDPKPALASVRWSRSGGGASAGPSVLPAPRSVIFQEWHDGRKVREGPEPQPFEELRGRPVEHRPARALLPAHLLDEPPLAERSQHPIGVDATNAGDLVAGDGLLVGDDRERLQGGLREPGVAGRQHELLHVRGCGRMGEHPPPPRDLTKRDAGASALVLGGEGLELAFDVLAPELDRLGERRGGERLVGQEQDRLERLPDGCAAHAALPPRQRTLISPNTFAWRSSTWPSR